MSTAPAISPALPSIPGSSPPRLRLVRRPASRRHALFHLCPDGEWHYRVLEIRPDADLEIAEVGVFLRRFEHDVSSATLADHLRVGEGVPFETHQVRR